MKSEIRNAPAPDHQPHVHRRDGSHAFVQEPGDVEASEPEELAESLAESYVRSATSGEHAEQFDRFNVEELGGPFLEDGGLDLPPDGFAVLSKSLRPELTEEPDLLGTEPPHARHKTSR